MPEEDNKESNYTYITELKLIVLITKLKNINAYIYQGNDRFSANVSIIENNTAMEVGKNYTVPYKEGMLLIAYPDKDVETEFEFEYY